LISEATNNEISGQKTKDRVRLNVTVPRDAYDGLVAMADNLAIDLSELTRHALYVYHLLYEEVMDGRDIYIGSERTVDTKLVLPGLGISKRRSAATAVSGQVVYSPGERR